MKTQEVVETVVKHLFEQGCRAGNICGNLYRVTGLLRSYDGAVDKSTSTVFRRIFGWKPCSFCVCAVPYYRATRV